MSATQRRFGAGAVKSRSSRSDGLSCPGPAGTVVRGLFLLAATPAIPSPPISRSTVHPATSIPPRPNSRPTFPAPQTPPPLSPHPRLIAFFHLSPPAPPARGVSPPPFS